MKLSNNLCGAIVVGAVLCVAALAKAPPEPKVPVTPTTQPGNGYNWIARHNAILKIKGELNPDVVFIGDSITHH